MNISLKYKINFVVIVVILLFSPILFIYFPNKQKQLLTESYEHEVLGVARTISLGARIALEEQNFGGVQTSMEYASNDKRMLFVSLFKIDPQGNKIFFSVLPTTFNPELIKLDSDENMVVKRQGFKTETFDGEIVIGYSKKTIKDKIAQATQTTFIFSGVVSLVGILLGFLVSRLLTRPITDLIGTTKKITSGDLSVRAISQSKDETGQLADSFNFMIEKLQENTLLLEEQKKDLNIKNKQITDSINYSRRIQQVLLYNETDLKGCFPNAFMFFKPKDIVSGDFLWVKETEKYSYIALVDCTGHGVPGAMMSIIGHFILNNIYYGSKAPLPGEILEKLNASMRISLKQETQDASDGMDIALCRVEKERKEVVFSGGNRSLYHFKNDKDVIEYKGERKGIGGKPPKTSHFENHTFILEPSDWMIAYTDGIQDQFGAKGTKFGRQGVNKVMLENFHKSGTDITQAIKKSLHEHQGDTKQIDDILLIGIKI